MKEGKPDLQNIGNAGEYFIASVLSGHGFTTTITLGRAEAYDIIAISPTGKTIKIQVKTSWAKTTAWRLGEKNEDVAADDFFYAFVSLNEMKGSPEYWIVPSKIIAPYIKELHKIWLNTPGKKGQAHNDNPGRAFTIIKNKYTPSMFTIDELTKGHNNLRLILDMDKNEEKTRS